MADVVVPPAELRKRRTRANNCNTRNNNSNNSASASPPQLAAKQQSASRATAVSSTTPETNVDDADTSCSDDNRPPVVRDFCPTKPQHRSTSASSDISNDVDDDAAADDAFRLHIHIDPMAVLLFAVACATRVYRLAEPNHIVFDELHYGKYVSLYMRRTFFFDQHPPLGKQLIAGMAWLSGYDGNFTFSRIGAEYSSDVPTFALRILPALCGSILAPCVYKLLLQVRVNRWIAVVGGMLIIFDNALLTQSRFILMESLLLTFSLLGLLFLLKSQQAAASSAPAVFNIHSLLYACLSACCFTAAVSVKFVGIYSAALGALTVVRHICTRLLPDRRLTVWHLLQHLVWRGAVFVALPAALYVAIFYVHLAVLHRAGPHDSAMTSAFQASLDGGLASITRGQPRRVVHGSQITLRHTLGRTCWLHSHAAVYPVRYADGRGSSHQQQVTCYSFKDVNNWWIVKRPEIADLVVLGAAGAAQQPAVRHGDHVQLVHGITSRALNTHDVAAAVTPQAQEVACYIDYNVSMAAQILWRVEVVNRAEAGSDEWHAIRSQVRLVHVDTGVALRFSGRQLPDWGYNQHEVVGDRVVEQTDTIWNVEEHRYTLTDDQKERERQLLRAEMIPTAPTVLTFWQKFAELQSKMLWHVEPAQTHMYGSEPLDWPLLSKGIAYWVDSQSNAQIHLLGNIVIWYSGTLALLAYVALFVWYLLRRRRQCLDDLPAGEWQRFQRTGELYFVGYALHFVPYMFVERTMFLHHYLPALVFKVLLLCCVLDHGAVLLRHHCGKMPLIRWIVGAVLAGWVASIVWVFVRFAVLSYGNQQLSADEVHTLRWKETWDFVLHNDLPVAL